MFVLSWLKVMINKKIKLSFHLWKDAQVKKDSKENNVMLFLREKDWYFNEYGKYCNRINKIIVVGITLIAIRAVGYEFVEWVKTR
jgi:hypothetical protein